MSVRRVILLTETKGAGCANHGENCDCKGMRSIKEAYEMFF